MIKVELVCQNEEAEKAVAIICKNSATPYPADGIVYVADINDAYRIKTGKSIKRFNK
jgi:nitrogen regulatory protein P-II 1